MQKEHMNGINRTMLTEVLRGMRSEPKSLPSKYFYDEKGSELFDRITRLEEYYPTRTERKILKENLSEIEEALGEKVIIIEPGSGSSEKTRILLDELHSIKAYIPIDISGEYLKKIAEGLREEYPGVEVLPLSEDYTRSFELPDLKSAGRKIVFFPGSTIGNYDHETVLRFFEVVAGITGSDGGMLIGVDLKKEREVLLKAYNDSEGVTAEFNKNMLDHLNREAGTSFKPELTEHKAIWNEEKGRIEMRLYVKESHTVQVNGDEFTLSEGEYIHTENSHKYSLDEFRELVAPWFRVSKVWTDENNYFSVQYLTPN